MPLLPQTIAQVFMFAIGLTCLSFAIYMIIYRIRNGRSWEYDNDELVHKIMGVPYDNDERIALANKASALVTEIVEEVFSDDPEFIEEFKKANKEQHK